MCSLEVGLRAVGLSKSFLIFLILGEVPLLHVPHVGADYMVQTTSRTAQHPQPIVLAPRRNCKVACLGMKWAAILERSLD